MKKTSLLLFALLLSLGLTGCEKEPANDKVSEKETQTQTNQDLDDTTESEAEKETESEEESGFIKPLDSTVDLNQLTNGTFAIALENEAFSVDSDSNIEVIITVYDYELYEASDIENLKLGDTIQILEEEIVVTSLEQTPLGNIIVNGGFEMGGYDFTTKDGNVYFITGASDAKNYYELGLATLPVASDFVFYDEFDMDQPEATYEAEDFLEEETEFYYSFSPYNTSIVIENGYVTEMHRIYTP